MSDQHYSSVKVINTFLKADPEPPKASELMAFMKDLGTDERDEMTTSLVENGDVIVDDFGVRAAASV